MNLKQAHLTVQHVGTYGNANDGEYRYVFSPEIIDTKGPTEVVYTLSEDTPTHFQMHRIFFNDPTQQIRNAPNITERSIRFTVTNDPMVHRKLATLPLILLIIQVRDTRNQIMIDCDPQVTCSPAEATVPGET